MLAEGLGDGTLARESIENPVSMPLPQFQADGVRPAGAGAGLLLALLLCARAPAEDTGNGNGSSDAEFLGADARTAPTPEPRKPVQQQVTAAPEGPPEVEEWPHNTLESLSLQGERASEALFDLIEDVEVASIKLGRGEANARLGRQVFDNHDVLGSWTVVDHVRLDVNYPFYSVSWPVLGPVQGGWTLGGDLANSFIDIRQVLPKDFARLPSLQSRAQEISTTRIRPAKEQAEVEQEWAEPFAGLGEARWGRLWNILVFPARAPVESSWVSHMADNEVISFVAEGTVQIGPQLLWSVPFPHFTDTMDAQCSVATYLSGQFRISILRESSRFVRVRLTRTGQAGLGASAGGYPSAIIHGFTVIRWNLLHNKTSLIPFTFNVRHGKGRSIDVVYRYDLFEEQGRQAFANAVQGRFLRSEQLSGGGAWRSQPPHTAVQRLAVRDTTFTLDYKGTSTKYSLIYRHGHESTHTNSQVTTDFPARTSRIFRSDTENSSYWHFIWGSFGSAGYSFRCDVDRDRAREHAADAATLQVRAEMTDTDTTGEDLYAYMDEAEHATGRNGFFPRPPKSLPNRDFPTYRPNQGFDRRFQERPVRGIDYGRSSFFYQLTFSQDQLSRFINIPDERRWPLLESAFGAPRGAWSGGAHRLAWDLEHIPERLLNIPLYAIDIHYREGSMLAHARAMIEAWRKAATGTGIEEQVADLGAMFSDRRYGDVLVRLLRAALPGEAVSYVIQGSSHGFGYLRDEGTGTAPLVPLVEQSEQVIDFDRQAARPQDDPSATISALQLEPLGGGRFRLTFRTSGKQTARDLYLSLLEIRPWHWPRQIGQSAYFDVRKLLAPGTNILVLSSESGPFSDLLRKVLPGNAYVIRAAYSQDGRRWGPISDNRFTMPQPTPVREVR